VCCPSKVASRITSLHQTNIVKRIIKNPNDNKKPPP